MRQAKNTSEEQNDQQKPADANSDGPSTESADEEQYVVVRIGSIVACLTPEDLATLCADAS